MNNQTDLQRARIEAAAKAMFNHIEMYNENVDQLAEKALAAADAVSLWLDIETAPKDETWFLGVSINRAGVAMDVMKWKGKNYGKTMNGTKMMPTHWMPLPTPPQQQKEGV